MKILCIDDKSKTSNGKVYGITKGKIYKLAGVTTGVMSDCYFIIDDHGKKHHWYKNRFRKVIYNNNVKIL